MDHSDKPTPSSETHWGEGLEFELADIEEARRILDAESIAQSDVVSIDRPERGGGCAAPAAGRARRKSAP